MSNEQMMEDIDRTIKQAAIAGTLTEDAIGYYNGLIKLAEEQRIEIKGYVEDAKKQSDIIRLIQQERDDARKVRDVLLTERDGIIEREKWITILEQQAKWQEARVLDHKHMMETIFKPHSFKESVYKSVPKVDSNGYETGRTNENEDKTRTED
jgi:hypothetical protein